jgi:hypothetical protein
MARDPLVLAQVKAILEQISMIAPGKSVELRVPPFAAIQCVNGPKHTRGTPPNVVEMNADTLFDLIDGSLTWQQGVHAGAIQASGERADLSSVFQAAAGTIRMTE